MNYYSEFTSYTGKDYRVDFYTSDGNSGQQEMILGAEPFVTEMSSDNDTIYSPIKPTGATVTLHTDTAPFQFYTENPVGIKVTLTDVSNPTSPVVEWSGYTTPCAFDMPYNKLFEEIEIECVDMLSVLKNLKYKCQTGTNGKPLKELRSFGYILNRILGETGCRYLYITNSIQINSATATESVLERVMINEDNFYDERDNAQQSEWDLAWSSYDILFEICQYFGYTAVTYGQDVVILDYDAIRKGNDSYFRYTVDGNGELKNRTTVTLKHELELSYNVKGDSSELSLTPLYNKVSVKDEFHTINSMLDDAEFKTTNITSSTATKAGAILFCDAIQEYDVNGNDITKQYVVWYAKPDSGFTRWYVSIYKFLQHDDITTYHYDGQHSYALKTMPEKIGIQDLLGYDLGCTYCDVFRKSISETEWNNFNSKYVSKYSTLTDKEKRLAWASLISGNISFSKFFIMRNYDSIDYKIGPGGIRTTWSFSPTDNEDCLKYPYFTYKGAINDSIMVGGSDAYLRISGKIFHRQGSMIMTPMSGNGDGANKTSMEGDFKFMNSCYHWARLKVGNRWWNGEKWQTTQCNFKLWILKPDGSHNSTKKFLKPDGGIKVNAYWDKEFDFVNINVAPESDEPGYYIPAPDDGTLTGNLEFTFFCPRDFYGASRHNGWGGDKWKINGKKYKHDKYSRYYNSITCLKDFDIEVIVTNGIAEDQGKDSDTIYFNSLENASVDELDEITFRITTYDNKNNAYSTPVLNNTAHDYVQDVYHKNLNDDMKRDNGRDTLLPEQMMIYRIVRQYCEPRIKYEFPVNDVSQRLWGRYTDTVLAGKTYVPDFISIDYKKSITTLNLVEKI